MKPQDQLVDPLPPEAPTPNGSVVRKLRQAFADGDWNAVEEVADSLDAAPRPSIEPSGEAPLTDALITDPMTERESVLFLHARTLERELAALRSQSSSIDAMRGECHDAAERGQGCFRALKAERELAALRSQPSATDALDAVRYRRVRLRAWLDSCVDDLVVNTPQAKESEFNSGYDAMIDAEYPAIASVDGGANG